MSIQLTAICSGGSNSNSINSDSPIKSTLNSDATPSKRQLNQYKKKSYTQRTHTASHKSLSIEYSWCDKMQTKKYTKEEKIN